MTCDCPQEHARAPEPSKGRERDRRHPAGALRGRGAGRRREGPRLDLPRADRGGRVDGLRAVRALHGRRTRRSSPTSCASWPRTRAPARSRARARGASWRAARPGSQVSRARRPSCGWMPTKLQLFDPDDGRNLMVDDGRRRPPVRRRGGRRAARYFSSRRSLLTIVSSSSPGCSRSRADRVDHLVGPLVRAQEQVAQAARPACTPRCRSRPSARAAPRAASPRRARTRPGTTPRRPPRA